MFDGLLDDSAPRRPEQRKMSEFLARVALHGHPLAVVLACGLLGLVTIAGFWLFRDSAKTAKAAWLVVALALLSPIPVTVWVGLAYDLNPTVHRREAVGTWCKGSTCIRLAPDGSYVSATGRGT